MDLKSRNKAFIAEYKRQSELQEKILKSSSSGLAGFAKAIAAIFVFIMFAGASDLFVLRTHITPKNRGLPAPSHIFTNYSLRL